MVCGVAFGAGLKVYGIIIKFQTSCIKHAARLNL